MNRIIATILSLFCISSVAFGQYPAVNGTVTRTGDVATYTYTVTNTAPNDIWEFDIFMPFLASDSITSHSTTQSGWSTLIRIYYPDMICWNWENSTALSPGYSAGFSFTTPADVPTIYDFHTQSTGSNWAWSGDPYWNGGYGNTRLPVPTSIYYPVPEPSSLFALGALLVPCVGLIKRRRA